MIHRSQTTRSDRDEKQQRSDGGAPATVLFDGLSFRLAGPSMDDIRSALNTRCIMIGEQRLARNFGAEWKRRFRPDEGHRTWRIQNHDLPLLVEKTIFIAQDNEVRGIPCFRQLLA